MAPLHWVAFITGIILTIETRLSENLTLVWQVSDNQWNDIPKKKWIHLGIFSDFLKFNDLFFPCKETSGICFLFHDTVKCITSNGTTRIQLIWFSSVFCGLKNSKGWKNRRYFGGEVATPFLRVKKETWIISLVGRVKSRFGGSLKIRRFFYRKWEPLHSKKRGPFN